MRRPLLCPRFRQTVPAMRIAARKRPWETLQTKSRIRSLHEVPRHRLAHVGVGGAHYRIRDDDLQWICGRRATGRSSSIEPVDDRGFD